MTDAAALRDHVVRRVARELKDGDCVNLGIGIDPRGEPCRRCDITLHSRMACSVSARIQPTPTSIGPD